ncbi:MAG: chemotaxis protein CheA, partial [Candidatus Hadarchaeales archaeon]
MVELEALASILALADEDDRESLDDATHRLQRILGLLKPPPLGIVKEAHAFSRASGKFLRGRKGGFKELCRALDRMLIALQKITPSDALSAEGDGGDTRVAGDVPVTSRLNLQRKELEDLCMDVDVLTGLAEEFQPSFVPGMLNILERNLSIRALPRSIKEKLATVKEHLLRLQGGDAEAGEMLETLLRMVREDLASLSGADGQYRYAGSSGEETRIEEELERLDELEAFLLSEEDKENPDLSPAASYFDGLPGRSESLGMEALVELFADVSETLKALPDTSVAIDRLLRFKDLMHRHLQSILEGKRSETGSEGIREILEDIAALDKDASGGRLFREDAGTGEVRSDIEPQTGIDADPEELNDFIAEAPEDIQRVETALLELERDPTSKEWLNEAFRGFHNLKGSAGFLNLKDVVNIAHAAENLLSEAREGKIELTGAYADLALQALDLLKEMLVRVEGFTRGKGYSSPVNYPQVLQSLLSWKEMPVSPPDTREGKPSASRTPSPTGVVAGKVAEGGGARHDGVNAVSDGHLPARAGSEHFIKVSTRRLDGLIDVVGELVIAHSMVAQEDELRLTRNPRLAKNLSQLSKIVRELQELAMSLRMVSLKGIFQKMARAARDLSVRSGVPVEFTYSGEDTEIDRNVVEEIANPLVHMIRNAIDHGIEPAEERRASGKPERGRLHLRGYHQGGSVVIELEDDGRGIDHRKVLARARSLGLLREGEELSREEILQLIFREGFSTAEKVTDISGRGVGMDVVKRTVEALRGRVEVHSVLGRGTRVTLRLPLTLAIIDGMVTRVAGENYILPSIAIL